MAKKQEISYTSPGEGFWTIPGVVYKRETRTYRLFEQMTPEMTQDNLSEFYEQEKQKGNPHPTDMPLIMAIASRAYGLIDNSPQEAEELRNLLKNSFRTFPNTLTRIIYNPSGEDKIIHNYKTSDQYSLDGKVVGLDSRIDEISDKIVLEKLLGTQDVIQINKVSQWINKTNSFIWRLNSKPKTKDERVARFDAFGDGRFDFYCDRDLLGGYPAFRVLRVD